MQDISALFSDALALHQRSRFAEATALYRRVLAAIPDHADAWHLLGVALMQQGLPTDARPAIEQAIGLRPDIGPFRTSLGQVFQDLGFLEDAKRACEEGLRLDPRSLPALNTLGTVLHRLGDLAGAVAAFEQLLGLQPNSVEALNNLGSVLRDRGDMQAGLACYDRALAFAPSDHTTIQNRSLLLMAMGRANEAVAGLRRLLREGCRTAEIHAALGTALRHGGFYEDSLIHFAEARRLAPDRADMIVDHAGALLVCGMAREAIEAIKIGVARAPDSPTALSAMCMLLHYGDRIDRDEVREIAGRFARAVADRGVAEKAGISPAVIKAETPKPIDSRRLRIGYVSADLYRHPVGYFLWGPLAHHDRQKFEIFCYADTVHEDDLTTRMRGSVDHWRRIAGCTDQIVYETIKADRIDILVDLAGHTAGNRLAVFARRAAPVQISWLGYFATTGLAAIDGVLMDEDTVPPGAEDWFCEPVYRVPEGRFCFVPPDPAIFGRRVNRRRDGGVVFGSFNNVAKLNHAVLEVWAKIVNAVPDARLVLKWKTLHEPAARARLSAAFAAVGGDRARLELRPGSPYPEMLREYGDLDLALDPFPFTGGATSCEALWCGVPVLTWMGETPVSRQTGGFLRRLGVADDLCVDSRESYIARAIELGTNAARRADLDTQLAAGLRSATISDPSSTMKGVENYLLSIYRYKTAVI